MFAAGQTFQGGIKSTKIKLYEWISNTNLLIFLIIVVILLFLGVCGWIFYSAFYPDGIPQHLKEDYPSSEDSRSNRSNMMDNNMMMNQQDGEGMAMMQADNGNGAALEM